MTLIASGHQETEQNWPGPLQRDGARGLCAVALPVVLLSAASVLVFAVVLAFLQRNRELRTMFSLEFGGLAFVPVIAIVLAAALAWTIAARCRRRPGPLWPRLWALFLALLSSLVTVVIAAGARPELRPFQHALALACLAAALTLAPRLLRLHPDSPWVQRIAPASLVFVLLAILPPAYYLGADTVGNRIQRLESRLAEIDRQVRGLRDCAELACPPAQYRAAVDLLARMADTPLLWESAAALEGQHRLRSRLDQAVADLVDKLAPGLAAGLSKTIGAPWPADSGAAEKRLKQLQALRLDSLDALLRASAQVNRPAPALAALDAVAAALVGAMGPDAAPSLRLAPVVYGRGAGPFPRDTEEFPAASARIAGYFRALGRLFLELEEIAGKAETAGLADLAARPRQWRRERDRQLAALGGSWAGHWAAPFLAEAGEAPAAPGLSRVLAMPVLGDKAAANLQGLLDLSRSRADDLRRQNQAGNCEAVEGMREGPGDPYRFSLRCRAYAAGPTPEQTGLRVELRLIYEDAIPLAGTAKPDRLYFIFPVPPEVAPADYRSRVAEALAEARTAVRDARLRAALPLCSSLAAPQSCIDLADFAPEQKYVKIVIYRQ